MIKRTSSRNSRSRGFKTKHALQICLLLGVCFWLIYQVKHSHAKKEESDKKEAKISVRSQNGNVEVDLGRKSLRPRVEKHEENEDEDEAVVEEDESKHQEKVVQDDNKSEEDEGGEEESKNEEDEKEEENDLDEEEREDRNNQKGEEREDENKQKGKEREDENKNYEEEEIKEEDERGGGDDEIDERDLVDEEKEREEISENEEGETDKEGQLQVDREDHEAREKHYKADDASSAVTHDTRIVNNEMENTSSNGLNNLDQDKNSTDSKDVVGEPKNSTLELGGVKTYENDGDKTAEIEEKLPKNATNEQQVVGDNKPMASQSTEIPVRNTESGLNLTSTVSDKTENTETAVKPQNTTAVSTDNVEESGLNSTSTVPDKTENTETVVRDLNSSTKPEVTAETEENSRSSTETKETENAAQDENSDKNSGLSTPNGTGDVVRDPDPIDTTDTSVGQDMKDARIDLNTLPGNIAAE